MIFFESSFLKFIFRIKVDKVQRLISLGFAMTKEQSSS